VVRLRLKRFGRRHRPFYRLTAMDARSARDSRAIEELGFYDPIETDDAKAAKFNEERVKYWLGQGAQPSNTVSNLLKKYGIDPTPGKKAE
jgi:small subunit ribosomal protein S16